MSLPFSRPKQTWDERFGTEGYLFGTEPNAWLREHAQTWSAGQRVLCVADGEGRNSVWLAARGHAVEAFDISAVGVQKARALAEAQGVELGFHVAHCDNYDWQPGAFDATVAIFVQFADPLMRSRLFSHMARSLKPGGQLLVLGYTPQQLVYKTGGPGELSHLYTSEMLHETFAAEGLSVEELREFEADLTEGSGHLGRSALVGLVASSPV
jgi:SAM-dependent methyltransferase